MKLISVGPELTTRKEWPGLLSCEFTHKIASANAHLKYDGPFIGPKVWEQILGFFQWTYDTTHSESQVRLYINLRQRAWAAWAYPQEARTGMSARELDTPEKAKQRAQFSDGDGWLYFGTVHHHCSAGAFQSGTDATNEQGQDGLHITMGAMDKARYELHARFYLGGACFEPDMAKFWDIGPGLCASLPQDLWDRVARFQMCAKVAASVEYPAQWKENLIEVKSSFPPVTTGPAWETRHPWESPGYGYAAGRSDDIPAWIRAERAVGQVVDYAQDTFGEAMTDLELSAIFRALANGEKEWDLVAKICEACAEHNVGPMDLWQAIPADNTMAKCLNAYRSKFKQHQHSGPVAQGNDGLVGTSTKLLAQEGGPYAMD